MIKIQGSIIWLSSTYERQLRGASGSIELQLREKSIQKHSKRKTRIPIGSIRPDLVEELCINSNNNLLKSHLSAELRRFL